MASIEYPFIKIQQKNNHFFLTKLKASHLTKIAYASVRGDSQEEGAVQRILSPRRIAGVRDFVLEGGDYPNCIVLNWVGRNKLKPASGKLSVSEEARSAQIIDGQHRVAGLMEAIKSDKSISSIEIPVALYEGLNTQQCADIFLSINTEQKPVPRTLVFDLYGVASEHLIDQTALRAKDVATSLNEAEDSPYQGMIKFPGSPRMRGGIALSTVVTALKPLVDTKGPLDQAGIKELERQTSVLINFFGALKDKYGDEWDSTDNAFLYASGFMGALQLFKNKMIDYCLRNKSFKKDTVSSAIKLASSHLIRQAEVRGQSGSSGASIIYDRLIDVFDPGEIEHEIEI
ncbi:MAG: DGQHR domain-containing protein [Acidobacteria bacterium]|nr:DGQHR domain-containing protein [Acidobacteriota bacterium]